MCSKAVLDQLLAEVARYARECFGDSLEAVILYGSYARGDADDESDIDIMLLVKQSKADLAVQRKAWNCFGTDLDLKYGVFTSFKLQDSETFHAWLDHLPFFRNVNQEGVRISG